MSDGPVITRERIVSGEMEVILKEIERQGFMKVRPWQQRVVESQKIRAKLPPGDVYVFAYGSLIWNPACHVAGQVPGRIHGWHRRYCLETPMGRGTPDCPGLMLALDRGGSCQGVALRLAADQADEELGIVFRRELVSDAYLPAIVRVHTADGPVQAATFVMNRSSERYRTHTDLEAVAQQLAAAEGYLGTCAEYLCNTVAHLKEVGLTDRSMFWLEKRVRELLGS